MLKREDMASLWDQIEARWPVRLKDGWSEYGLLRRVMQDCLVTKGVTPRFSHFGVVVRSLDVSLSYLDGLAGLDLAEVRRDWVEAYQVYVARIQLEGAELELLESAGESFFSRFQRECGEGLQHLSFQVEDVDRCLDMLRSQSAELVDEKPRSGSHGEVAFVKLPGFEPLYTELCQPR